MSRSVVVIVPVSNQDRRRLIRAKAYQCAARRLRRYGSLHDAAVTALHAAADALLDGIPDATDGFGG